MMSPSLSAIATDLGFKERERDLYIGSYMQLCYAVVSLPPSLIAGVMTDHYNRVMLLTGITFMASLSMIGFGIFSSYPLMLFLRTIQGTVYGACIPVIYSLMSDLFSASKRARMSAFLTVAMGGGTLFGQLFAGYMAPIMSWRTSFILFGVLTFLQGIIIMRYVKEPTRGVLDTIGEEDGSTASLLSEAPNSTSSTSVPTPPPMFSMAAVMDILHMLQIPTVALMLLQSIPNSIPWGLLSVHMHDFLITEGKMQVSAATSLIAMFGAGAAVGGVGGGVLGTYVYTIKKIYLPLFMGITLIAAGLLMQYVLAISISSPDSMVLTSSVILLAGTFAAVNGSLNRAVLLNVASPYTRGAAVSSFTVMMSLGRGVGPAALTSLMHTRNVSRQIAMENLLYLWVFAGTLLLGICVFIVRDEENMRDGIQNGSKDGRKKHETIIDVEKVY